MIVGGCRSGEGRDRRFLSGLAALALAAATACGGTKTILVPVAATPPPAPVPTTPSAPLPSPTPSPEGANVRPTLVLTVSPDPPRGFAPLTVAFNACRSSDADGDEIRFSFRYGDGELDLGLCRARHTYRKAGRYETEVCTTDQRPNHKVCKTVVVKAS